MKRSAILAADAVWAGACLAAVLFDGLANGGFAWLHALFAACALAPAAAHRLAAERAAAAGVRLGLAILWIMAAATLVLTSDAAGAAFAAWFALPAAAAVARGAARRHVLEALGLTAIGAIAVIAAEAPGAAGLDWSYGVLPMASALAVAAYVALAAIGGARRRERELTRAQARAARLAAALEATPDTFWRIDAANRIVAADGGGAGRPTPDPSVWLGCAASQLFEEAERPLVDQALERVRRTGERERHAISAHAGRMEVHVARTNTFEIVLAVRRAGEEIDALPEALRGREEAEAALRARSRFVAGMSHELRTPLNAVLGFSDAMRSKLFGPLPAKYADYAEHIHESASHLLDIVGDLLDVSKIEAGRYELEIARFDARDAAHAVKRMLERVAESKDVLLEVAVGDAAVEVDADPRAFKQMLLNLASNAVKFTDAGGEVRLVIRASGGELIAEVADTGSGLSSEEISRIGQPFEQADAGRHHEERGTGLGLALVRSLCELHGGRMEIESEPAEGSVFRLRLPVVVDGGGAVRDLDARGRLQRIKKAGFGGAADAAEEGG